MYSIPSSYLAMAASDSISLARIFYYAREKFYNTVQTTVLECKEKYGSDPVLTLWESYALLMQGE